MFRGRSQASKFQYITQLFGAEQTRKFNFLSFFFVSKVSFLSYKSKFCTKSVLLRYTMLEQLKNPENGRGTHQLQMQLMNLPSSFLGFEQLLCISKEHIVHVECKFTIRSLCFVMKKQKETKFFHQLYYTQVRFVLKL